MRSDEAHNGQLCNWWPAYDARAGYAEFSGGAALIQSAQKNDAGRKGAHKRFGKAVDPSLDFVDQMAQFHAHRFSPGYALAGGSLSTASDILWMQIMQSGHAQEVTARRYVELRSPTLLYSTWAAF